MEVQYEQVNWKGNTEIETVDIPKLLYDEILNKENYRGDKERIRLEDQPQAVLEAMGRLVSVLMDKNILNLDDLKYIADCRWSGRKSDTLALKPEEKTDA